MKLKHALRTVFRELSSFSSSAYLDSELLLSHVLAKPKVFLYTYPEYALTADELKTLHTLVQERKSGKPMAYILQKQAFWTIELKVTPSVLIPRPETECLVEQVLALLPATSSCKIADLGTGSGAIAIALAKECPNWQITAIDCSESALRLAKENAHLYNVKNITFQLGNWCGNLPLNYYDAIVSNPPYIAENDPALEQNVQKFEPTLALIAGKTGFECIEIIIKEAQHHLKSNGYLIFEHGYRQSEFVQHLFQENHYKNYFQRKDYANYYRYSLGQKN